MLLFLSGEEPASDRESDEPVAKGKVMAWSQRRIVLSLWDQSCSIRSIEKLGRVAVSGRCQPSQSGDCGLWYPLALCMAGKLIIKAVDRRLPSLVSVTGTSWPVYTSF